MIRFRIVNIKGCKTSEQVLLMIERNDNGEDYLKIVAWHLKDDEWFYQEETFDGAGTTNDLIVQRMLLDFSEVSANEFANSFTF